MDKRLAFAVIVLICSVWAANFGAQFIVSNYKPDPTINMIFMGIVGGLFALQGRKSNEKENSDDKDESGGGSDKK